MKGEARDEKTALPLLALGGVLGAIAASACCVLPLVLASLGVSGAWIGSLAGLAPYQPIFLGLAAVSIGAGFWLVYGRKDPVCPHPARTTAVLRRAGMAVGWLAATKAALWLAALIFVITASAEWWARLLA